MINSMLYIALLLLQHLIWCLSHDSMQQGVQQESTPSVRSATSKGPMSVSFGLVYVTHYRFDCSNHFAKSFNRYGLKAWSLQCILQQCFEELLPHYQARLLYLLYPCTRLYSAARVQTGIVCSTCCPLNALSWHKAGLPDTRSLQHVQQKHAQEQPRCCRVTLRFRHMYRQNVTRSLQAHRRE